MKTYRVLVIGAGFWGKRWIQAVQAHSNLELCAVVARSESSCEAVASAFSVERGNCLTDLRKALGQSAAEIVAIVSPAANHVEHVTAAMQAGCHVICEKPLADTWDAARQIASAVHAHSNQRFMVSQTRRFSDQIQTIRDAIVGGMLGKVDAIAFDHRVNFTGGGWRQEMDLPVLEDMISHHLDALRYITGEEPVSVYVEAWNPPWSQFRGRASNHMLVTMTGGIHVTYFGTWTGRGQLNSYDGLLKVMGEKGALDLVDPQTLMFYPYTGAEQGPSPSERVPIVSLQYREIDGVIENFLNALESGSEPACGIDDNLRTFAFNWAVLQSCRTGQRIDVQRMLPIERQERA